MNGMKPFAFLTKTLLTYNILLFPIAVMKAIEVYFLASFEKSHDKESLMFDVFTSHLITSFAIVNLYYLTSKMLSERHVVSFILVLSLLPICLLYFLLILNDKKDFSSESEATKKNLYLIFGFINPATRLVKSLTELSKEKLCARPHACLIQDTTSIKDDSKYEQYPECMDLFVKLGHDTTEDIDEYCKENPEKKKTPVWLEHLTATLIVGAAYLSLLFVIYLVNELRLSRVKKLKKKAEKPKKPEKPLSQSQNILTPSQRTSEEPLLSRSQPLPTCSPSQRYSNTSDKNYSVALDVSRMKIDQSPLPGLSLQIRKHEILCILGNNGSEQSAFINILAGLASPNGGVISYNNEEYGPEELSKLTGYCSQRDVPLIDNTIDENLNFFAQLTGRSKEDIKTVKSQVGLTRGEGYIQVSNLSADQKMMLNMAIVLLSNPEIIIMDEPTTELDSSARIAFEKLLRDIRGSDDKKTVIFTTQTVKDAELADRVAIFEQNNYIIGKLNQVKEEKLQGQYILLISVQGDENNRPTTKNDAQTTIQSHLNNLEAILLDDTIDSVLKYQVIYSKENRKKFIQLFEELAKIPNIEINFKRQSLDVYLERHEYVQQNEIEIIPARKSSLKEQIWAILLKRFYTWKRRKELVLLLIFFIALSLLAVNTLKQHPNQQVRNLLLTYLWLSVVVCGFIKMIFTISNLIKNRNSHQNHVLKIMGMSPWGYWLGNLIADFISLLPLIIGCLATDQYVDPDLIRKQIVLIISAITLALNVIVFSYNFTMSKFLNSPQNILLIIFLSLYMSFYAGYWITLIDNIYVTVLGIIAFLLPLSPFQLFTGVIIICDINPMINDNHDIGEDDISHIISTWISIIITFLVVIYKDSISFKTAKKQNEKPTQIIEGDKTIQDERNRVNQPENKDFLKFLNVYKRKDGVYDHIIDKVTFGIPQGSLFALVGHNRGGKSEILDLYGRETFVSSGSILLQGQELPLPYHNSDLKIGFCLPTNALWKGLSVRQHLEIYARIKGVPSSDIQTAAKNLIVALGLEGYAEEATKKIKDQGILRKLSVALAVIGAPDLLILDEPTKGLDPVGRKQVWKILKKMNSTILMATNQLEDAEEKADRIGIMVKGRLVKIDPEEKFFYLNVTGIKEAKNYKQLKEKILEAEKTFKFVKPAVMNEEKLTFRVSLLSEKEGVKMS